MVHVDRDAIDALTRERCVELLMSVSIQCYDHETVETLREAIYQNVLDGTLEMPSAE